ISLSLARSLAFSCSSSNHRLLVLFNSLFASPLLPLVAFRCGLRCRHLTSIRTPRRYYCFEGLGNQKGFDGQTHARWGRQPPGFALLNSPSNAGPDSVLAKWIASHKAMVLFHK
ncbi:unnamed protein product, partial [Musa acuminata subsp. burmannicoides]